MGADLDYPVRLFKTPAAWAKWLAANHGKARGLWVRLAKKGAGLTSISYAQALEAALCYGWIDGTKRAYDDASWIQKFTPRGPNSVWSQINRDKAEALIKSGAMQPAGLAAVTRAKANGRWAAAYGGQKTMTVPADLQAALDANPRAKAFFAALSSANRYAILYRVLGVKKPETRAKNIAKFVAMCAAGKTVYPQKGMGTARLPKG